MKTKLLKILRQEANNTFEIMSRYSHSLNTPYFQIVKNSYFDQCVVEIERSKVSAMKMLRIHKRNYILSRLNDFSRVKIFGFKFII